MKQPGENLGINLGRIRQERNLSFDNLAELTGVSKSMLRQIEIGQSNPTIATLWKIANGLRIPFTELLQEQTQEINLKDFKEKNPLQGEGSGYRLYPLTTFNPQRSFETYYVELDPGTMLDAEPHQGNAEEHVFVLKGQIEITVANNEFVIGREQYLTFQADCEHQYRNGGLEMAAAIMLISYLP
jgi:transcriptional regulator with XRE-family HTH domain